MFKRFGKKSASIPTVALLTAMSLSAFSPLATGMAYAKDDTTAGISIGKDGVNALTKLDGNEPKAAQRGKAVGHKNSTDRISFLITLKPRNASELDQLISDLSNPASPRYKQFITPADFTKMFGATKTDLASVTSFLKGKGLSVDGISDNNLSLNVSGTTAQVEAAFNVAINEYVNDKQQSYYANDRQVEVPASLTGLLSGVHIDNEAHWSRAQAKPALQPRLGSGPNGGYTPAELRNAYNVNGLISAGIDGTGQKVAVFELDGYKVANVNTYYTYYSLGSPTPQTILVDGYNGAAGGGQVEVELDIEIVNAIAPKALVQVYEGPNSDAGVVDTYQRIATDNTSKVVSVSWGMCELDSTSAEMNSMHTVFQQMATQGQSVFDASGDSGAYDCKPNGGANANKLAVDSPANDPLITGVGGTKLTLSGSSWGSEVVWGTTANSSGGGGGISTFYTRPSYQVGTGVDTAAKRQVPDVSGDADPASGYSVYSFNGTSNAWFPVGGTSAAAPLWAGIAALNNQYAGTKGHAILGQANVALYALFNGTQTLPAFHDITSGNNLFYAATAGFDKATGIGTPNAYNLVHDLNDGTIVPPPCPPTCPPTTLQNGGFESGNANWTETSVGGYEIVATTLPHSGTKGAYMCGYNTCTDTIAQTVTLPATATSITLTYWTNVQTTETSHSYDYLYTQIRNTSGTVLTSGTTLSDATATGWVQRSVNLTAYKGQTIQVYFKGTTDSSAVTKFFVDDVAITVS